MSTESWLANLVNGPSTARVLTVGDVMLDRFVYGTSIGSLERRFRSSGGASDHARRAGNVA